jgi:hypothetical protein
MILEFVRMLANNHSDFDLPRIVSHILIEHCSDDDINTAQLVMREAIELLKHITEDDRSKLFSNS